MGEAGVTFALYFAVFGAPSKLGRTYKLKGVCFMN